MRYLSLFSGIGMHDLGFERAGWQCVGQVEIDPFCTAVLEKHWPHVPRWADVRDVSADGVVARCGHVDLITGGFACQDVSTAGKGAGLTRFTRSGITFRNLFRLARRLRPAWIVIENVPALRTRGYDRCVRVLERIGYACRALVVGAGNVGAPHRRQRVWIVADAQSDVQRAELGSARGSKSQGATEARSGTVRQGLRRADDGRSANPGATAGIVADSSRDDVRGFNGKARSGRRTPSAGIENVADAASSGCRSRSGLRFDIESRGRRESVGTHSWPSRPGEPQHEWEAPRLIESAMGGTASGNARRLDGFARRNALKAIGNGNPPQVAELIARTINAAIAQRGAA